MIAQVNAKYLSARPTRVWSRLLSYLFFEGRPLTTRGRWFNPVVFAITKTLKRLPSSQKVVAPGFIVGTGRAGTTILGIVLSMHQQIGFLNEPKALWASLHPHEDLIGSYNRNAAQYRLAPEDASATLIRNTHRVYSWYLRVTRTNRVIDKYPELIFRTEFIRKIFPDARFLFLSRNSAATCGSIRRWSERLGRNANGEIHDWWGVNDRKWSLLVEQLVPEHADLACYTDQLKELNHEGRAAVEWIITMREGIALANRDPEGTIHIPYESLCTAPAEWAFCIQDFLGLQYDPIFASFASSTFLDPDREYHLDLPDWLADLVAETEIDLSASRSSDSTVPR